MNDVKPCPFCGDDTAVEVREGSTFPWRVAVCGNCGAQAGEANGRAAALREWNTRLEPAQPAAPAVPLTDERKHGMWARTRLTYNMNSFGTREAYLQGIEDAERAHGIVAPEDKP